MVNGRTEESLSVLILFDEESLLTCKAGVYEISSESLCEQTVAVSNVKCYVWPLASVCRRNKYGMLRKSQWNHVPVFPVRVKKVEVARIRAVHLVSYAEAVQIAEGKSSN
jgi:glyoxylate carboligase